MKIKQTYKQSEIRSPLFRTARRVVLTFVLFVMCGVGSAQAGVMYNFVQDTGDILATMVLDQLPATHTDISSFTFTADGETIFGLGPDYLGDFSSMGFTREFVQTLNGPVVAVELVAGQRLIGLGSTSLSPFPGVPAIPAIFIGEENDIGSMGPSNSELQLTFGSSINSIGLDVIKLSFEATPEILVSGNWKLAEVPEPTSATLWATLTVLGMCGRTRRRRKNTIAD